MGFTFPAFAHSLCYFFALGQLLVNDCVTKGLLGSSLSCSWSALFCGSHLGESHLGMCRPDGLAGSHRPDTDLDMPQCFHFNPAWTSWPVPSLLPHTLCSWWLQCLCPTHFPQEGSLFCVSVGLSLRDRLPEKLSLSNLAVNLTVCVLAYCQLFCVVLVGIYCVVLGLWSVHLLDYLHVLPCFTSKTQCWRIMHCR